MFDAPRKRRGVSAGEANENDRITGVENAEGNRGDDILIGTDGPNELSGNGGSDRITGGNGNDRLYAEDIANDDEGVLPWPAGRQVERQPPPAASEAAGE